MKKIAVLLLAALWANQAFAEGTGEQKPEDTPPKAGTDNDAKPAPSPTPPPKKARKKGTGETWAERAE